MPKIKLTLSNALMLISVVFTILFFILPGMKYFQMNDFFFSQWKYHMWLIQCFTSQFIHGGIMHLVMNSVFILYFGNVLEHLIGYKKMLSFFIVSSLFVGISLIVFSSWNTVWISWFALAVLTYYTLLLKEKNNPEYMGWVMFIAINIFAWFWPWISFIWHFSWMVIGWLYWYIGRKKK